MMNQHSAELVALASSLSELVLKGTATAISTKLRTIKNEKDADKIRATYDEIVNELLSEREEAVRIAQVYKAELEAVVISDEDIQHLHNTVSRILEIIKELQLSSIPKEDEHAVRIIKEQVRSFEAIKELISVDTLKTMQLLGFNYKAAIGEPLTMMLKNFILSKVPKVDSHDDFQKFVTPELVEILKNKNAYDNFRRLTGIEESVLKSDRN